MQQTPSRSCDERGRNVDTMCDYDHARDSHVCIPVHTTYLDCKCIAGLEIGHFLRQNYFRLQKSTVGGSPGSLIFAKNGYFCYSLALISYRDAIFGNFWTLLFSAVFLLAPYY